MAKTLHRQTGKSLELADFETLLKTHRAANHKFFAYLEAKSRTGLNVAEYQAFAVNYIARTVWTLPEVAAAGSEAARDFRVKATAFSSATFYEEGGDGDSLKAHSALMIHAINYHGKAVYGEEFKSIDPRKVLDLTRAAFEAMQAQAFNNLDNNTKALIQERGIFNFEAVNNNLNEVIKKYLPEKDLVISGEKIYPLYSAISLNLLSELKKLGIHDNVIAYGFEQIAVMRTEERGKLQGCAYAHEGFADNMMLNVFKIMKSGTQKYQGRKAEFDIEIYPYFSAHGDYYAMAEGKLKANEGGGVEAVHARREAEKIEELPKEHLDAAYRGAREFADRQALVWDAMLEAMKGKNIQKDLSAWQDKFIKRQSNLR